MHPVKIDELLQQTEGSVPIKHDDSPFAWLEIKDNAFKFYYNIIGIKYEYYSEYIEVANRINRISTEIRYIRTILKEDPNWEP